MIPFNKQFWLIVLSTVILLFGLCFGLMRPRVISLVKKYREIFKTQEVLEELRTKKEKLISYSKRKDELNELLKRAKMALPPYKEISSFMIQLEEVTASNSLSLKTLDIKETPTKTETKTGEKTQVAPASSLAFNLSLSGKFRNVLDFLSNLETSPRFLTIQTLDLKPGQGEEMEVTMTGEIYYKKTEKK